MRGRANLGCTEGASALATRRAIPAVPAMKTLSGRSRKIACATPASAECANDAFRSHSQSEAHDRSYNAKHSRMIEYGRCDVHAEPLGARHVTSARDYLTPAVELSVKVDLDRTHGAARPTQR